MWYGLAHVANFWLWKMGQGLAVKRLAQPLSKPEAMLLTIFQMVKKMYENDHRVKKQIRTKFAIWVQKCKFHECTSFARCTSLANFPSNIF